MYRKNPTPREIKDFNDLIFRIDALINIFDRIEYTVEEILFGDKILLDPIGEIPLNEYKYIGWENSYLNNKCEDNREIIEKRLIPQLKLIIKQLGQEFRISRKDDMYEQLSLTILNARNIFISLKKSLNKDVVESAQDVIESITKGLGFNQKFENCYGELNNLLCFLTYNLYVLNLYFEDNIDQRMESLTELSLEIRDKSYLEVREGVFAPFFWPTFNWSIRKDSSGYQYEDINIFNEDLQDLQDLQDNPKKITKKHIDKYWYIDVEKSKKGYSVRAGQKQWVSNKLCKGSFFKPATHWRCDFSGDYYVATKKTKKAAEKAGYDFCRYIEKNRRFPR